ncbi:TetR/AcrR family transcriptional regulator [Glycomyces xiaoerkulensis]|uniref:TetR/AcrR family transcriptional regulator n=1 Tax=Glycomyces xiaoerkulensis TaxID=2038139 RepID=UPI000C2634A7|nr:TetR/AcrR family transcriptional regulator [Glycomyces xiaoerkulensis]
MGSPEQLDDGERCPRPAGKGRPRSSAASQAIIDATLDLLAEEGTTGAVSIGAVAERSGVSKATIYRRWSGKEELIATAVDSLKAPIDIDLPHTSVRDDLLTLAGRIRKDFTPREQAILNCVALELRTNPDLRRFHDELHQRRRAATRRVFELGIERGELRPDIDLDLAVVMLVAPMLSIQVYEHHPELKSPDLAANVIDHLLRGLHTEGGTGPR